MENKKRGSFSGSIGFVLAAAGSAVGLGNLWRFPYLAAQDGGGLFLVIYVIMALTFGFTLLTTEITIGRKTGLSGIRAFGSMDKRFGFMGPLCFIVPFLIFPYYCVIGGWVMKYGFSYIIGAGAEMVADGYFGSFITSFWPPIIWTMIFMGISAVVVYCGVERGIEKFSKVLMPALCLIVLGIAVFSLTLRDPESGRTAIDGLKIYLVPNFEGLTVTKVFKIAMDAVGQIFYSMSIAMGIMITYGSYVKKEANISKSVNQIEIFDTGIAVLAGLIMIPSVYTFQGTDGLSQAGPGLLFKAMPKIFAAMGGIGTVVAILFFVLVLFAAMTSSVSLMEAVVSMLMDKHGMERKKASTIILFSSAVVALLVCLGYNVLYFEYTLPNGSAAQILDILDFVTNNLLMPIAAILTCVFVGWFAGTKVITDEIKRNGEKFGREGLYKVMVTVVAPVLLFLILIGSFGIFSGI